MLLFGLGANAQNRGMLIAGSACNDVIRNLLARGGEGGNVDYKAPIGWPKKNTDERATLVRHLIGFANARDGGYILIGVDDSTKEPQSLSEEQARSWDATAIGEVLARFSSPPPEIEVCRGHAPSGELLVAVHVTEFASVPCVCILEHVREAKATQAERMILRKGALYLRTGIASTREIDSEVMMRELLARASVKTGQKLLEQIKSLIDAHWPGAVPADSTTFVEEAEKDFEAMGWP